MSSLIGRVGNDALMQQNKAGFFASTRMQSDVVMRCYDWATEVRNGDGCIVSGFSSTLERDVLHFLFKGECPIVMVLARSMSLTFPEEWKSAADLGRLMIVSTCRQQRQSPRSAMDRNQYIADICDKLVFVGITEQGSLFPLTQLYKEKATIL